MSTNVTVLTDEMGLQREYREVEREARVGERVVIVEVADYIVRNGADYGYKVGDVYEVVSLDYDGTPNIRPDGTEQSEIFLEHQEYRVLEPTEIVHVNGERFRMVDREAMGGERIVTLSKCTPYFQSGDVGTVHRTYGYRGVYADFNGNNHVYEDGKWYVSAEKYRVLEPLTPAQQAQVSEQQAQIDGLTETVANLARRLSEAETQLRVAREDIVLIEDGVSYDIAGLKKEVGELRHAYTPDVFPDEPEAVEEPVVSKTSTREEIIEKAKADVAELLSRNHYDVSPYGVWFSTENGYYSIAHKCEFVVDRIKRTVVALIRETEGKERVELRGIAKCAPNDCFNVHIGMAIALRRALGLDIPKEYLNAPQPDEARVGDYVEYDGYIVKVEPSGRVYNYTRGCCAVGSCVARRGRIIDDSRDGRYGEVYSV